jgi:hypothetical protein
MTNSLLVALLALTALISIYIVRSLRTIGSKVTEVLVQGRNLEKKISSVEKKLHSDSGALLAKLNLLNLEIPSMRERDFTYILSLTSHPARFDALALALPELIAACLRPNRPRKTLS